MKKMLLVQATLLALVTWTCVVQSAPALIDKPNALLAIDKNRATVVERIVTTYGTLLEQSDARVSQQQLRSMLQGLRADDLLAASLAGSLSGLRDVLANAANMQNAALHVASTKALGDTTQELVYTPVVPCRILDTRNGTVPPYNAQMVGGSAFPVAANLSNFAPQGGAASNCGLPASYQAIAVTLTVINPNFDAFLAASNTSNFATLTQAVVMDFTANHGLTNTAIVPVDGTNKFYLGLPPQVTTQVIADAVGYFAASAATALDCVTLTNSGSARAIPNGQLLFVQPPACGQGYTRTGGGCWVAVDFEPASFVSLIPLLEANWHDCAWGNFSGTSQWEPYFNADTVCCRVPGPTSGRAVLDVIGQGRR